jgi:hypothetical protein
MATQENQSSSALQQLTGPLADGTWVPMATVHSAVVSRSKSKTKDAGFDGHRTRAFGKPPDSLPMPEVAEWKFPRGGCLQVYQLPERAGHGSCTLAVSSIAEMIAPLENLGIDTSQRTSDEKVKTLMITDPDGNHIAFAETIDKSMAK